MLVLARVSAAVMVLPVFSWTIAPMTVRAGLALLLSVFFAGVLPPVSAARDMHWAGAVVLMVQEVLVGIGLGLALNLVFLGVQQGARMIELEMGLAEAEIIDPTTSDLAEPVGLLFEMTFAVLFLVAGGHLLLVRFVAGAFEAFPLGRGPDVAALTSAIVESGSQMLLLGLKLAAPVLAAFLVLSVVLAILARVMPEMDILFTSLPLRVGLGLLMAAAVMPALNTFVGNLGQWMGRLLS